MSRKKIKIYTTWNFDKLINYLKDKYSSLYYIFSSSNQAYDPSNYDHRFPHISCAVFKAVSINRVVPSAPYLVLFNSFRDFDIPSAVSFHRPSSISVETLTETDTEYKAYFDVALENAEDSDNPIIYTIVAQTEPYDSSKDQYYSTRKPYAG